MKEFKIRVSCEEISEFVQRRLFKLGYNWKNNEEFRFFTGNITNIFADKDGVLTWGTICILSTFKEIKIADLWEGEFQQLYLEKNAKFIASPVKRQIEKLRLPNIGRNETAEAIEDKINEIIDYIYKKEETPVKRETFPYEK